MSSYDPLHETSSVKTDKDHLNENEWRFSSELPIARESDTILALRWDSESRQKSQGSFQSGKKWKVSGLPEGRAVARWKLEAGEVEVTG